MAAEGSQNKNFPPRSPPPLEVKPFYPPGGGLKNHSPPPAKISTIPPPPTDARPLAHLWLQTTITTTYRLSLEPLLDERERLADGVPSGDLSLPGGVAGVAEVAQDANVVGHQLTPILQGDFDWCPVGKGNGNIYYIPLQYNLETGKRKLKIIKHGVPVDLLRDGVLRVFRAQEADLVRMRRF